MVWLVFFATSAVGLWLWLHYLFEGEILLRDVLREWRLGRTPLSERDRIWQASQTKSDIVVSLTTIPSRIGVIDTTLKSLLDQSRPPKRIYLNVPEWSQRENCAYEVPAFLTGLKGVIVRRCEDWGPATKVIPALLSEDSDQLILVTDDDRIYPKDMLEVMEQQAVRHPDQALACAGWVVPKGFLDRPTSALANRFKRPPAPVRGHRTRKLVEIDIVLGVFGYAIRPLFFDVEEMTDFGQTPRAAFLADDVRTSALCKVPKMVIPVRGLSFLRRKGRSHLLDTALAKLNNGGGDLESRSNTIGIRHYSDRWRVGGSNLQ